MKGYPNDLYILAFDHRGTLTKGLLGVEERPPTQDEIARVSSMKDLSLIHISEPTRRI